MALSSSHSTGRAPGPSQIFFHFLDLLGHVHVDRLTVPSEPYDLPEFVCGHGTEAVRCDASPGSCDGRGQRPAPLL